ncbi:BamA/TamA family outer membrane protein, partial [Draconibacterium sp.]|nr:BamA/TamA family outer membrane protein [Draconibacterium sp.]
KLMADYFKYLGEKQNLALRLTGLYNVNELPLYDDAGAKASIYSSDYISGGFKFQSTNFQNSTFGVGVNWSDISFKPKVNPYEMDAYTVDGLYVVGNLNHLKYSVTTFSAFYSLNNLNRRYFPTRGMSANIEVSATSKTNGQIQLDETKYAIDDLLGEFETSSIKSLKMDVVPVIPVSKKFVFLLKAKMKLSSLADSMQNVTEFDFIGGFRPDLVNATEYYGAGIKEYYLANYFYGRLGTQYELWRNVFLQAHINVVTTEFPVTFLYPNADTGDMAGMTTRFGYGGSIGMNSPVGPVSFAVAKDHYRDGWKASLIIGFHY